MRFAILVVGNEILSGEVSESNANYMAKKLTMLGHKVERIVVVPDRVEDIAEELRRLLRYDFVFVSGGLGATHDDVTAEGIAEALGKKLVHNDTVERYVRKWTDKREVINKISKIPAGAEVVENSVGVAPAFVVDKVAALPGVPNEMKDTFEKIVRRFSKEDYHVDYLRIEGYEENIVNQLHRVVEKFPDVEIGSYPKPGYVLVKFSGRDMKRVEEAKRYLESLLS
ncbi:molybdenum cofactor synthesis domain [Geoglobus ahangari]|uniref:Molybdenum cofactor synthesis domain n=1 Tax=Geoglobus ahangari TaxID=113653 RepID=A0A0F7IE20_9EURY|nr:molybdopterin-binding protein [Geoglobus ahangari]AKG91172.1 molybdenum cofactor synthesis domain [Geoglobus ahangari]NOY12023.1 competence/damage-inducible protein A [Archaeoglobi archaeon]